MELSDPTTFASMYDEHSRGVYGAALRILGDPARAQDVAHDVFLKVWRDPSRYDAKRGDLGSYLRLMARSRALDVYRGTQAAARARDRLEVAAVVEEPLADDRPSALAELGEDRAAIRQALRRLPESQREALVLAYWGGMTADEIAQRSGVPLGTAKSRIRLGLSKLKAEVEPAFAAAA